MTQTMIQLGMSKPDKPGPLSRRRFLATCLSSAACALCASLCAPRALTAQTAGAQASPPPAGTARGEKARIRLVFSHPAPGIQGWPYVGYDFEGRKTEFTARLRSGCPNIEFLPAPVPRTQEDTTKILAADSEVDGYVLYLPSCAPELNPDEGVWSLAKRALANGRPDDLEELVQDLIRSIDRIRKSPTKLRGCILQSELPPFLR